ncbi:sulfotransferase family protein [Allonocardiopsis opalescens]|uniref:Sulfotransferase family protein n=1 Tax=Allonocardiopsis opalescens TaxID=1144618 RepID=A0A2T0QD75_9ACTN|nr:sulfotransferase [Allonocardiopsis opalescens]PRY01842.1 sulfotransferase family protein [Allonocardiopsis opalescens]
MRLPQHTLVFVGGLHHSGACQLSDALAAHPDVSVLAGTPDAEDSTEHRQSVYPPDTVYGGAGRFCFDAEAHLTESSPLVRRSAAQRLLHDWGRYWDLSKRVLVETAPPNLVMTRFLQRLYPDAVFVLMVRHPVAVSVETRHSRWTASMQSLLEHWLTAHELFLSDAPHVRRYEVVRYEDLLAEPERVLSGLCARLRLGGHPLGGAARRIVPSGPDAGALERRWPVSGRTMDRLRERFDATAGAFGYRIDSAELAEPRTTMSQSVTSMAS